MDIQPQAQVFDVNEQNFEELVLQGSTQRVIVVDFWAPWCEPCKNLGPVLEEVVAELGPGIALAKINVDENQQLAAAFRVQGIPAVKIVKDGQMAQEFTGALPKDQIESILRPLVDDAPIPEDEVAAYEAEDLAASGDLSGAAHQYEKILEETPNDSAALLGLARIHLMQGNTETVQELVNLIEQVAPEYAQAQALLSKSSLPNTASRPVAAPPVHKKCSPTQQIKRPAITSPAAPPSKTTTRPRCRNGCKS
ncbi:MAG: thioredoxin [Candidatus Latescibacterota bacterium]